MRHLVFGRKLGRDINARKALLRNLSSSLVAEGFVVTTLAKAKFTQGFVEKLVTSAKKDLSRHRDLASVVTHEALLKFINELGPGFSDRQGGYTRIIKLTSRLGDGAPMARLELVDWDKSKVKPAKAKTPKPKKAPKVAKKEVSKPKVQEKKK